MPKYLLQYACAKSDDYPNKNIPSGISYIPDGMFFILGYFKAWYTRSLMVGWITS